MTLGHAILIFFAAAIAGAINAVAGGGTFISFPVLMFTGVPPVAANATNALALVFGSVGSGRAYRRHWNLPRRVVVPLLLAAIAGALAGAFLLIHTRARTFLLLVPWLLLGATLLFILGGRVTRWLAGGIAGDASNSAIAGATFFELLVGTYGGYFGAGMGIINLAVFSALGLTEIHAMNALNVVLGGAINGAASITFIRAHTIYWPQAVVMSVGAACGGYASAHGAQRVPKQWIRRFVVLVGLSLSAYFFYRAYR